MDWPLLVYLNSHPEPAEGSLVTPGVGSLSSVLPLPTAQLLFSQFVPELRNAGVGYKRPGLQREDAAPDEQQYYDTWHCRSPGKQVGSEHVSSP